MSEVNDLGRPPTGEGARIVAGYTWRMLILCPLDIVLNALFTLLEGDLPAFATTTISSLVVFGLVFVLIARRAIAPVRHYLATGEGQEAAARRAVALPIFSMAVTFVAAPLLMAFRMIVMPLVLDADIEADIGPPLSIALTIVTIALFYPVFVYFVISDYMAALTRHLSTAHGVDIEPRMTPFAFKIFITFVVASIVPITGLFLNSFIFEGEALRERMVLDVTASSIALLVSFVFILRSLNMPLRDLARGMERLGEGKLDTHVPVTSNDEIGTMTQRFNHMVGQLKERERIREAFGKYVSTSVAKQIIEDDDGHLDGDVRLATIMFTDIYNFTTISESLKPAATIELLNEYLELVIAPIERHGGVINNFIGDGLFVTFNLPIEDPHHADSAVHAAIEISRSLDAHEFTGGHRLDTRIGINTGVVVAGTIGAGDRLSYTVLGDEVNIAARTEPLNKEYGSRILITGTTFQHLRDRHATIPVGEHEIRGRAKAVQLYKVEV